MYGGGHLQSAGNPHQGKPQMRCAMASSGQTISNEGFGVGQSSIQYAGLLGVLALQQPKVSILLGHRALGCLGMRSDS